MSLDVHQSILDALTVKVVVVSVGDITRAQSSRYADILRRHGRIELMSLPRRPPTGGNGTTPFPNLNWTDAEMLLKFVDMENASPSDWEDFHNCRRVQAVVGIIPYDRNNMNKLYAEFIAKVRTFNSARVYRCFVVDSSDGAPDTHRELQKVTWLPDEGGPVVEEAMLSSMVKEFTAELFWEIEKAVQTAEKRVVFIATPLDPASTADDNAKLKKKRSARLQKCLGDYALMCGGPKDAQAFFQSAHDQALKGGDLAWAGGACEGLASVWLKLKLEPGKPTPHVQAVVDKYIDAIAHYGKAKASSLEMEACFKLARYFVELEMKQDAHDIFSRLLPLSSTLGAQDQILVIMEIALLCEHMGHKRKFAFYLRTASQLYERMYQWQAAHRLLLLTAKYFYMDDLGKDETAMTEDRSPRKKTGEASFASIYTKSTHRGWPVLQRQLYADLIDLASKMVDPAKAAEYTISLLNRMHRYLDPQSQRKHASNLQGITQYLSPNSRLGFKGLAVLQHIEAIPLDPHNQPFKPSGGGEGDPADSVFIYSPFVHGKEKQEDIIWVQGELVEVKIVFSNPLSIELAIENASLTVDHGSSGAFEAYPLSFVIPAKSRSFEVVMTGKPLISGPLKVRGCIMRIFGLVCEETLESSSSSHSEAAKNNNAVSVIPALPMLVLENPEVQRKETKLFKGETHQLQLALLNVSSTVVTNIKLSVMDLGGDDGVVMSPAEKHPNVPIEREDHITWDQKKIDAQVPVNPGSCVNLPVMLRATKQVNHASTVSTTIVVEYGGSCNVYKRKLEVPTSVSVVKEGVYLQKAMVLPPSTGLPLFSSGKDSPEHGLIRQQNIYCVIMLELRNDSPEIGFEVKCSMPGRSQVRVGNIDEESFLQKTVYVEPMSAKRVLLPMRKYVRKGEAPTAVSPCPPSPRTTSRALVRRGSSDRMMVSDDTMLAPTLSDSDVIEHVLNHICRSMKITWTSNTNITGSVSVPRNVVAQTSLANALSDPVAVNVRLSNSDTMQLRSRAQSLSDIFKLKVNTSAQSKEKPHLGRRASQGSMGAFFGPVYVATLGVSTSLSIARDLVAENSRNKSATPAAASNIRQVSVDTIKSEIERATSAEKVNPTRPRVVVEEKDTIALRKHFSYITNHYAVREFKTITFSVQNNTQMTLSLDLLILPYQEGENGEKTRQLHNKMAWRGPLERVLEDVPPGESVDTEFSVCFFAPGVYKMWYECHDETLGSVFQCREPISILAYEPAGTGSDHAQQGSRQTARLGSIDEGHRSLAGIVAGRD